MVCVQRRAINENYRMRWESGMEWFEMKLCVNRETVHSINKASVPPTIASASQAFRLLNMSTKCSVFYIYFLSEYMIWAILSYILSHERIVTIVIANNMCSINTHTHTLSVLSMLTLFVLQHTGAIVCLESIGLTKSNVCNTYDQHKLDRIIIVFITFGLEGRSGFLLYKHCNNRNRTNRSQYDSEILLHWILLLILLFSGKRLFILVLLLPLQASVVNHFLYFTIFERNINDTHIR